VLVFALARVIAQRVSQMPVRGVQDAHAVRRGAARGR
jgi:hypothetical protein